jgi:DNA recombination protein RmuC
MLPPYVSENTLILGLLASAVVLGFLCGAWITRHRWRRRLEQQLAQFHKELDFAVHELHEQQRLAQSYREQGEQHQAQQAQLHLALLAETEKRAAFAEQAQRIPTLEAALGDRDQHQANLQRQLAELQADYARLQTQLSNAERNAEEKIAALQDAGTELKKTFQALASEALTANGQVFLQVATSTLERFHVQARADLDQRRQSVEEMVRPLSASLQKYDQEIRSIEQQRQQAYARLSQQVESLSTSQVNLIAETGKLVKALRLPQVRGRWGEMTLRRVVELAGMSQHCDFTEQPGIETDGTLLRPDLIVHLPGGKLMVIDAKAPLQSYLDALEATSDEQRQRHLSAHARHIRSHMQQLAAKNYWSQFQQTPEFVVLFLPGETFFSAALEQDAQLIETGVKQRVILATPTTLIALLRAVAYGWQQQALTENALAISRLGKDLYERLTTMVGHLQELGRGLQRSVRHFNRTVGTLENRVLVTARKFQELGISAKEEIPVLEGIEDQPRTLLNSSSPIRNPEEDVL